MCRILVLEFFIENIKAEEFKSKRILEIGSKYVNGSVRPFIEGFLKPKEYVGVDIEPGKFVDVVLPSEKLLDYFGPMSFDVVISTETLEHVQDWEDTINNMKAVLRPNGFLYITTVEKGFPYHGYPYDFWRYEIEDMERIFDDFKILVLKRDVEHGVLLKAKKPFNWRLENYVSADLSDIALYSMVLGRRTRSIPRIEDMSFTRKAMLKFLSSKAKSLVPRILLRRLEKIYLC